MSIPSTSYEEIYSGFNYYPSYNILICSTCKEVIGTLPTIKTYLASKHQSLIDIKGIYSIIEKKLKNKKLLSIKDTINPEFYKEYFQDLTAFNCYQYILCITENNPAFITISPKKAKVHLNKDHKTFADGPFKTDIIEKNFKYIECQSFSSNSKYLNWFITSRNNNRVNTNTSKTDREIIARVINNLYQKKQIIKKQSLTDYSSLNSKDISGFLQNSQWYLFLYNQKVTDLLPFLNIPKNNNTLDETEQLLLLSYNITQDIFPDIEPYIPGLSRYLRQVLHTCTSDKTELRDFKIIEPQTKPEYHKSFPAIIVYILRLYLHEKEIKTSFIYPELKDFSSLLNRIWNKLTLLNQTDIDSPEYSEGKLFIKDLIICIFWRLLTQSTMQINSEKNPIFKSPVLTWFILSNFDQYNSIFKSESIILKHTSPIIYSFRLFFVAYLKLQERIYNKKNQDSYNFQEKFMISWKHYLINISQNIFSEFLSLRPYLRATVANKPIEGRIFNKDEDSFVIDTETIHIPLLKDWFKNSLIELKDILYNKLLFLSPSDPSIINLMDIKDSIYHKNNTEYFINYFGQNQNLKSYESFLVTKCLDPTTLISQTLVKNIRDTDITFYKGKIEELIKTRTKFLELLLVQIYCQSGAPIRGEEIVLIKFRNCLTTGVRNITIEDKYKLIQILTTYTKTKNLTRKEASNLKFLNLELSNILKAYLLIFIPFYEYLNLFHFKNEELSPFLFEKQGNKYTSQRLSDLLKRETLKNLNATIGLNQYRHLLIYIIKTRIQEEYNDESSDDEDDLIEDELSNHSTKISNRIYGKLVNYSEFDSLKRNQIFDFSKKFFKFFDLEYEISKKHKRELSLIKSTKKVRFDTTINQGLNNLNSILKDQSRSDDNLNNLFVTSSVDYNPNSTPISISSQINNNITSTDSSTNTSNSISAINPPVLYSSDPTNKTTPSSQLNKEELTNYDILNPNISKDLNLQLKLFLNNPNAEFRSPEQKEIIEDINIQTPYIAYINGTSSGKSLIYLFTSFLFPEKKVFVFVPRTSLKEDLYKEAQNKNLTCEVWNNNNSTNISSNLIFISLEESIELPFKNYLISLQNTKQDYILFFDEAHLLVTEASFRWVIKYIPNLVQFSHQIVFLSATLPFRLLDILKQQFRIKSHYLRTIQGDISRSNISYTIKEYEFDDKSDESIIKPYIENILNKLENNDKVLIFLNYTNQCSKWGTLLKKPYYHAQLDKHLKACILKDFQDNPKSNCLIGTKAIGVGLNIPNIRYVIHINPLDSLINLDQEIGRAGRDNQLAYSVVFRAKHLYNNFQPIINNTIPLNVLNILNEDKQRLYNFLNEKTCIRRILINYFNIAAFLTTCAGKYYPCYQCQKRGIIVQSTKDSVIASNLLIKQTDNSLRTQLEDYKDICYSCFYYNKDITTALEQHTYNTCPNISPNINSLFRHRVKFIKNYIQSNELIKPGYGCYRCYLPSTICFNKHIDSSPCEFEDIIIESSFLILDIARNKRLPIMKYFDNLPKILLESSNITVFINWLVTPYKFNTTDSIQALKLLELFDLKDIIIQFYSLNNNELQQLDDYRIEKLKDLNNSSDSDSESDNNNSEEDNSDNKQKSITEPLSNPSTLIDLSQKAILSTELLNQSIDKVKESNRIPRSELKSLYDKFEVIWIQKWEEYNKNKHLVYNFKNISLNPSKVKDSSSLDLFQDQFVNEYCNKLQYYNDNCIYCLYNREKDTNHKIKKCKNFNPRLYSSLCRDLYDKEIQSNNLLNLIYQDIFTEYKTKVITSKTYLLTTLKTKEEKTEFRGQLEQQIHEFNSNICSECLLPLTLCFTFRNNNKGIDRCQIWFSILNLVILLWKEKNFQFIRPPPWTILNNYNNPVKFIKWLCYPYRCGPFEGTRLSYLLIKFLINPDDTIISLRLKKK